MGLVVSTMGVWYFGSGTVDIGGLVLWTMGVWTVGDGSVVLWTMGVWYCGRWESGTVDDGSLVLATAAERVSFIAKMGHARGRGI